MGWEILVVDNANAPPPTDAPAPTDPPADADPPVVAEFTALPLEGPLAGATMSFAVNEGDPRAGGQDTVTIIYEVPTAAWVGIGFNDNGGLMVGSEAVIGLPDENTVKKYALAAKSGEGVQPLADAQQTLIEASITQEGGVTIMQFTKILEEAGEIPIAVGQNTFLGAYGSSNALGYHQSRAPFAVDLSAEGVATPVEEEEDPPAIGEQVPGDFTVVPLQGTLQGTAMSFVVNVADERAGGQDTITMIYEVPENSWVAIGFSNNGGLMVGSEAVIGLPDENTVKKYALAAKSGEGVQPLADEQQTLIDASITQEAGVTILQFTKILEEAGEIPIIVGQNTFLGSYGSSNTLGYHLSRGSFAVDLASGVFEDVEARAKSLWRAHGWCAGLAWGLFSPLAIGAAILRRMIKAPLWFKIHQTLNMLVIVLTICAFVIAIAAIAQESGGADAQHFSPEPYVHRKSVVLLSV